MGISGDGLIARLNNGNFVSRTLTAPAAGITVTNGNGQAGNPTLALANDLAAVEGLAANGLATRTADGVWAVRTLTAPAAGITVTNGDGVAGNPTLVLANDLAGLEGLSTNGIAVRTGDGTWVTRSIAATGSLSISNADGVAGNPTISFTQDPDLAAIAALTGTGYLARTAADTWAQRTFTGGTGLTVTNGDGVAGATSYGITAGGVGTAELANGGVTLAKLASALQEYLMPVGAVIYTAATAAPTGFLLCYGQAVSRTTYAALFTALGTTYGTGDGSTTFNLPDLRGRVAAGKDDMGGSAASRLTNATTNGVVGSTLGAVGGSQVHALTSAENGPHTHSYNDQGGTGNYGTGAASAGPNSFSSTTGSSGSGTAHNNVQPTIILNACIKY